MKSTGNEDDRQNCAECERPEAAPISRAEAVVHLLGDDRKKRAGLLDVKRFAGVEYQQVRRDRSANREP
jgi:hypothetical protein